MDSSYRKKAIYEPQQERWAQATPFGESEATEGAFHRQESASVRLEQILDLLYRRKWIILVSFLTVVTVVAVYTFTRVPEYESYSFIALSLERMPSSQEENPSFAEENFFARNDRSLGGELFLIKTSRTIAERVAQRLREMTTLSAEEDTLSYTTMGYVQFAPVSGDFNAIQVAAVSPVPGEAALLANLYAEEYVRLTQEASRTYLSATRKFLEEQEGRRREQLREIEEQVETFMRERGAVGLDQEGNLLVSQITTLETQRDEVRTEMQVRLLSLQSLKEQIEDVSPQLVQHIASGVDRKIQALQDKIAELEVAKEEILLLYPHMKEGEANRDKLQPINGQIQQLQEEVKRLSEKYVEEAAATGGISGTEGSLSYIADLNRQAVQEQITINGLIAKIGMIEDRLAAHQARLSTVPNQSMELARLERSRQHAEQLYQFVIQRLQETRIAEESQQGYAHILREATEPDEPVRPDTTRNLLLGTLFGLFLGFGLAFVCDILDNRIYKSDQLRELGYNVIGMIPNIQPLIHEDYFGKALIEQDGRRFSTSLIALLNPMSAATETYRHLRTNIQFSVPDTVVQTLLVTSPNAEEGKSTTAANLAIVMAQAERRTLLIDADLRRPQLHHLLGLQREPGLAQLLNKSDFNLEKAKTGIDNLFAITAGGLRVDPNELPGLYEIKKVQGDGETLVVNAAELLGSKRMREFLRELRNHFDSIIIDTPPVLAATDAVLLSTQCDATLLVVRAGHTKEGELDYSMGALNAVGATVIGTLLNGFDISMAFGLKHRYHHYSKYGPYSKYGYYAYRGREQRRFFKKRWKLFNRSLT